MWFYSICSSFAFVYDNASPCLITTKHGQWHRHVHTSNNLRKWHNWIESYVSVSDIDTYQTPDTPLIRSVGATSTEFHSMTLCVEIMSSVSNVGVQHSRDNDTCGYIQSLMCQCYVCCACLGFISIVYFCFYMFKLGMRIFCTLIIMIYLYLISIYSLL
jgi:hypothetical protein